MGESKGGVEGERGGVEDMGVKFDAVSSPCIGKPSRRIMMHVSGGGPTSYCMWLSAL